MTDDKIDQGSVSGGFSRLRAILDLTDVTPAVFVPPVLLGLGTAFFEGLSVALLLQLTRGILAADFSFAKREYGLAPVLAAVSRVTPASNRVVFSVILALIFLSAIAKNLLQYGSSVSMAYHVRRFADNARKLLFDRIVGFGKIYFDRTSAGHLHGVLMTFTNAIAYRLMDAQQLFTWFFMLITYLIMMTLISRKLTLIVLFVLPVLHYSLNWLVERIRKTSQSFADSQSDLSKKIFNILSCILLVKSYATEERERKNFADISGEVARLEYRIDKMQNVMNPIQDTIILAVILGLLSVVAFITTTEGPSRVSGLLVYFFLLKRSATAFGVLNNMKTSLATVSGPIEEILGVLNAGEKFSVKNGDKPFPGLRKRIEFKSLNYSFADRTRTLNDVTFALEQGRMTAIVGPTGAGKTTLINLLMRFYDPPPGAILIDGVDAREFTVKSLRSSMALVSQEAMLFNDTIRTNAVYGLDREVRDEEVITAIKKARLYEFVNGLPDGLDTVIGDRGYPLSGGERQRLSIARALLKGAEILILDEATSSLDTKTEKLIQEAIDEVIRGKTAIVIAHRLSTIKKADRIVVIDGGRVAEVGSLPQLMERKERFFQYWEDQKFA